MNLQAHYDAMRAAAFRQWARGENEVDLFIDSAHDDRRGITLLARPPAPITAAIETILADFQRVEPTQYYYPATDIHLTILSIISCRSGFMLAAINPAAYQEAVQTILQHVRPFTVRYSGLTASPGGIMVQGTPADDSLQRLRDSARAFFTNSHLPQSIDHRYPLQTAHSTVIRFRHPLLNPTLLPATVRKYEQQFIGSFEVDAVELVYNDWYQRASNTVGLEKYQLENARPKRQ